MKKMLSLMCAAALLTGCAYFPGQTDLTAAADGAGLSNVTTGDGTFENYEATGYHSGTEIGIGVGIPMLMTLFEIYPGRTSTELLTDVGDSAKDHGADAMINVQPGKNLYTGIPFGFIGIYVDQAAGTGIDVK